MNAMLKPGSLGCTAYECSGLWTSRQSKRRGFNQFDIQINNWLAMYCLFGKIASTRQRKVSSTCYRNAPVKLIIAIIQPNRLEAVKQALTEVEVFRLTVLDCQGFGRQKGHVGAYRGNEISINLLRKVQLQIAVNDDFVEPTVSAVLAAAKTGEKGQIGDGKVFILPMDDCIRIRTGERGPEAI
jgi:nitrogen regulatory protein P-II 2